MRVGSSWPDKALHLFFGGINCNVWSIIPFVLLASSVPRPYLFRSHFCSEAISVPKYFFFRSHFSSENWRSRFRCLFVPSHVIFRCRFRSRASAAISAKYFTYVDLYIAGPCPGGYYKKGAGPCLDGSYKKWTRSMPGWLL